MSYQRRMGRGVRSSAHHKFGAVTLDGTRMPVDTVVAAVEWLVPDFDAVRAEYPDLTDDQIRAALSYATKVVKRHSDNIAVTAVSRCARAGCAWCKDSLVAFAPGEGKR